MKPRLAATLAFVICGLTAPSFSSAQTQSEQLKTFTAPDGAFTFRYWDQLVHCEQKKQGSGEGYYWTPDRVCAAYHPVCDDVVDSMIPNPGHQTSIACFGYPRNEVTDTPAFEAATFSVEVIDHGVTRDECLGVPGERIVKPTGIILINGVSFIGFEFVEGGMNQMVRGRAYRTFRNGTCYQLGVNLATAFGEVFEPPARELSKKDLDEINGKLEQPLKSFRFLK